MFPWDTMFAIIQVHSGESVKLDSADEDGIDGKDPAIFDTEEEPSTYAIERFGEAAGREYAIVHADEIC